MLYVPKNCDYLKTLIDDEVKDFVVISFTKHIKSTREKLYSKPSEEQNLTKVAESFYIFLSTSDEVEKYSEIMQLNSSDKYVHYYNIEILNLFDPELKLIKAKKQIKRSVK